MTDIVSTKVFEALETKFKKSEAEKIALDTVYMETLRKCHELRVQGVEYAQRLVELTQELAQTKKELDDVKTKLSEATKPVSIPDNVDEKAA